MKVLFAVAAILLSFPAVVGSAVGATAAAPHAAPEKELFAWVPPGGFPDRFPFGQCTWWAAYNRRVTWGGNAGDWLVNAQAQGISTSEYPSVGAIVIKVTPSSYTVSEMNAPKWGEVSTRVVRWPDPQVQGFIPLRAG
jgi:hypothetical protein